MVMVFVAVICVVAVLVLVTTQAHCLGDWCDFAPHIGLPNTKGSPNNTKQTVQIKYEDVFSSRKSSMASSDANRMMPFLHLSSLGPTVLHSSWITRKTTGRASVCISDKWHCPVCALAYWYLHLCEMGINAKIFLSAYYSDKS
jgi:hypothetical protein